MINIILKKIIILLLIFILLLMTGCTREAKWNAFIWIEGTFGNQHYDKIAIFIPFKLHGLNEEYYVQLDTGATSVLNGNTFMDLNIKYKTIYSKGQTPLVVSLDGVLSNYKFTDKKFKIIQNYGPTLEELQKVDYKKIGNLGLDFFKNNIFIIDFPQKRFMVANTEREIPENIIKNSEFININIRNNKLYLDSKIGNKNLKLFYDTGASIFHIVTTESIWSEVTEPGSDEEMILLNVPSWGKKAQLKGARAKNNWLIGGLTIEKPLVFHETSGLENFNFKAIESDGLFGNAIFFNNYVVTIDLINNRLGIMKVNS